MPPKKEAKEKVVKGDEAEELVLQYLKSVNRPYASTDVSANLKNKVPKAAAQKVMQALADRGEITLKPYGKQTIFVYTQDKLPVMSSEDMAALDGELTTAQDSLKDSREELKELEKNLAQLESIPKTSDLPLEIKRIEAENNITLRALAPYRKTGDEPQVQPLSTEEIKKIDAEFVKWRKQWVDRRKVYKEIAGTFTEGGIMIDEDWRECQGITEDDEEALALESGEFCNPRSNNNNNSRPTPKSTPKSTATLVGSTSAKMTPATPAPVSANTSKRSSSDADSEESEVIVEEVKPKKKAKKA